LFRGSLSLGRTPDDCRTWIFHLRPGVKFHDGTPFNAEAVKFHFDRHSTPTPPRRKPNGSATSELVEVRDEFTVVFHFKNPNCLFPESIRDPYGQIPSPTAVQKWGNDAYGRHPVGTGPYIIEEMIPDQLVRMRKNHDYWNADAYSIERIEFRPVRENTTRLILLEQGVFGHGGDSTHVAVARRIPDIEVQTLPTMSIPVGFNEEAAVRRRARAAGCQLRRRQESARQKYPVRRRQARHQPAPACAAARRR
jgi:4-phytase/acid phosphatase/peptide/nickel transport system substrate-binding protein